VLQDGQPVHEQLPDVDGRVSQLTSDDTAHEALLGLRRSLCPLLRTPPSASLREARRGSSQPSELRAHPGLHSEERENLVSLHERVLKRCPLYDSRHEVERGARERWRHELDHRAERLPSHIPEKKCIDCLPFCLSIWGQCDAGRARTPSLSRNAAESHRFALQVGLLAWVVVFGVPTMLMAFKGCRSAVRT
jgi:hypothetical protein